MREPRMTILEDIQDRMRRLTGAPPLVTIHRISEGLSDGAQELNRAIAHLERQIEEAMRLKNP